MQTVLRHAGVVESARELDSIDYASVHEQNCLPIWMSAVRQKKELGWASPGLLDPGTHLRTWGTLTEFPQPLQQFQPTLFPHLVIVMQKKPGVTGVATFFFAIKFRCCQYSTDRVKCVTVTETIRTNTTVCRTIRIPQSA
jgi:hypothetical protein